MITATTASLVKSGPRRKAKSLDKKKARMGYIFVLPFILGFFIIYLPMIVDSLQISFSDIKTNPISYEWTGLKHYSYALFEDGDGNVSFVNNPVSNLKGLLIDVPAIVIFSLFMAIILNQKMHGRAVYRAIFFIPVIVSTGIIEYIDMKNILGAAMESGEAVQSGGSESSAVGMDIINQIDVQQFFASMQVGQGLVSYVTDLVNNVYQIALASGIQIIIFLSGMQTISPSMYEASKIEGATAWESFWKITFPMISSLILVNVVYSVIDYFIRSDNRVMQVVTAEISSLRYDIGSAMAWSYFLIVIVVVGIAAAIISRGVYYYE